MTRLVLTSAVFILVAHASAALAATLPEGEYGCYLYPPRGAIYVGAMTIKRNSYEVQKQSVSGSYQFDAKSGNIAWQGKPPLGFKAGALETNDTTGKPQIRVYPEPADIGNKKKAALCSLKAGEGKVAAAESKGAPGKAPEFKAGDKVEATYIGVWYPATVVKAESARYFLHYDDPKSKDGWVEANRVRLKK